MTNNLQTNLFGEIVDAGVSQQPVSKKKQKLVKVRWSFSRRNTMETCLRKYYYQYYAAKHESKLGIPVFDSVKFLKGLSSQHLVGGKILHNLIRLYLIKSKEGTEFSLDWLKDRAKEKIKESLEYSQAIFEGEQFEQQYPPFLLQEVFYKNPDAEEIYREVERKVLKGLEIFITSEKLGEFRTAGKSANSFVEKKFRIQLTTQIAITGESDLAYRNDNGFVICDWKTGKVDDGDDSMQLLTYTLWAMEEMGVSNDQTKIYKAYLYEDVVKGFSLSEREVFRNKMAIKQSAEAMLEMAAFAEAGEESAFTACRQPKICALCSFQKICK
jgi:CRISPR/Cas system-associated exonuclease Cas4 (RecB family)